MPTPTYTAFASDVSAGPTTFSFSFTLPSGTSLVMAGLSYGINAGNPASHIINVNWNTSEAVAQVSGSVTDDNNFEGAQWRNLVSPTSGTHNLTIDVDLPTQIAVTVVAFDDAGLVIETPSITSEGGSSAANPSLTVADTAAGNCVLAVLANDGSDAITGQSGTSIGSDYVDSDSHMAGQYAIASGANTVMSWTQGNTAASWVISGVAVSGGSTAEVDQEGARFGNDDGNEAAHTFAAAQDANITAPLGANLLLRLLLDGTDDPGSAAYTLRAQKNGSGGYVPVPVGTTTVQAGNYFGGASGGTNPTTSTTITIPASLPTTCVLSLHFTSRDHTSGTAQPTVSDNNGGASWTQRQFSTDRKAQWWWKRYEAGLSGKTITISGAVGSLSARLVVIEDAYDTGDPFTDFVEESNASGNETHAAITPTNASSAVVFAVYNYANDNAVTSVAAATTGAPGQSTGHLSTGGSDCATHVAVWDDHPASSSGDITWAQTNGTTYSHVYAVRPRVSTNEVYVAASSNITAGGEATTARLTPPGSKTTSDFTTGRRWDDENGSDSIDIASDQYTEVEWCLQAQSPASNGDYYDFRVYAGGAALDNYGVTPRWTIGTPSTPSDVPYILFKQPNAAARLNVLRRF